MSVCDFAVQEIRGDDKSLTRGFQERFLGCPENGAPESLFGHSEVTKLVAFVRMEGNEIDGVIPKAGDRLDINPQHP